MLLGASLVPLLAEGNGATAAACAPLLPSSRNPLLAEGSGAPKSFWTDRFAPGRADVLLLGAGPLLAEGSGALPSGPLPSAPAAA